MGGLPSTRRASQPHHDTLTLAVPAKKLLALVSSNELQLPVLTSTRQAEGRALPPPAGPGLLGSMKLPDKNR